MRSSLVELRLPPHQVSGTRPTLRLVGCPPAGSGANYFRPLLQAGRDLGIQVHAARYPGRESRLREPLQRRVLPLAAEVAQGVRELPDDGVPTVLLGHSLGVSVAAQAAADLAASDPGKLPELLVLSAKQAPGATGRRDAARLREVALNDQLLRSWMVELGGTPVEVLRDTEFMALQLPIMRADLLASLHADQLPPGGPVPVPLLLLCGDADPVVALEAMAGWRALVSGRVSAATLTGRHHAVLTDALTTLATITRRIGAPAT